MSRLDSPFELPNRLLDFTTARARALTTNIAHASEPGYRRVDVDFGSLVEAYQRQHERGEADAISRAKPQAAIDEGAPVGANGNTVDFEREQVQIDKNALLHELATYFVNAKLNELRSAIRGA